MNGIYSFVGGPTVPDQFSLLLAVSHGKCVPMSYRPLAGKGGVTPANKMVYHGPRRYSTHPLVRYHIVLECHANVAPHRKTLVIKLGIRSF